MRIGLLRWLAVALTAALAFSACGGPTASDEQRLHVVATTTVFGDLVQEVAGEQVVVDSLVPPGAEVHTFDPRPSDVLSFADADLVVLNGLGLDDWVVDLVGEAGSNAPLLRLGEGLPGADYIRGDEVGGVNPHLWLDVANAKQYVERIADRLAQLDPAGATGYRERATAYLERLSELDRRVAEKLGALPARNRRIVSFHDAFPYFARAYGLEVIGTVLDAPGQDPSAGQVAALIDEIRREGVSAILTEVQFPPGLAERIAEETGVEVIADLYTDSLGDSPVNTYEGMMDWDVDRLAEALQ